MRSTLKLCSIFYKIENSKGSVARKFLIQAFKNSEVYEKIVLKTNILNPLFKEERIGNYSVAPYFKTLNVLKEVIYHRTVLEIFTFFPLSFFISKHFWFDQWVITQAVKLNDILK